MRISISDITEEAFDNILKDSSNWVGEDELLFSDQFTEWLKEYARDAKLIEEYRNGDSYTFDLVTLTEGEWMAHQSSKSSFEFDETSGLLFKLTWL